MTVVLAPVWALGTITGLSLANTDVAGNITGACCLFVVLPALQAFVCWLVVECFRAIPAKYHLQEPRYTWLLMVPLFNFYWGFKVYPALAESFQAYFYSRGIADVDDCGEKNARRYCIWVCFAIIPCLGLIPGIVALVYLILFLTQADELKRRILTAT